MNTDPLPAAYDRKARKFAGCDPFEAQLKTARLKPKPRCQKPDCSHFAHFSVRDGDGELIDVCSAHFITVTTEIREAD